MATAHQIYTESVQALSAKERLKLASLILQELAKNSDSVTEYSDSWSEEDVRDLTAYAVREFGEDEESNPAKEDG